MLDCKVFNLDKFQFFCNQVSATKGQEYDTEREHTEKGKDVAKRIDTAAVHLNSVIQDIKALGEIADVAKRYIFYADDEQTRKLFSTIDERKFNKFSKHCQQIPRLIHSLLGIITEAGELAEAIIKYTETDKLDTVNVGEELADIGWYLCEGASSLPAISLSDTSLSINSLPCKLSDLLAAVQRKLERRYQDSKFSNEDAVERDLEKERKALESKEKK